MKVLIVGAGPTGLTAAVELQRNGIETEVIEKRYGASNLSRAIGINPKSLDLLSASGITAKLLSAGVSYENFRVYNEDKLWAKIPLTSAPLQHGHNVMLGLPQNQTETIIKDRLLALGGVVRYGVAFKGVTQNDAGITVTTTLGETIHADYLIGADGWRSPTRTAVGIEYFGRELPDVWSIADIEVSNWPHLNGATLCLRHNGGIAAVLPLGGQRVRLISNTGDAIQTMPMPLGVTKTHRAAQFKIWLSQMKEYQRGRVFLAGDAAHTQSPAGGRGMNLGIDDACDLVHRLANGTTASYTQERVKVAEHVIAGAEKMRKAVTSKSRLAHIGLLTGIKLGSNIPALRARIASSILYG